MLIFDIETAADPARTTRAHYDAAGRTPPGNYTKPDTIAKWHEQDFLEWQAKAALSPITGRVIAIGWLDASDPQGGEPWMVTGRNHSEPEMLAAFAEEVARHAGGALVSYNGAKFDLPFLAWRYAADRMPLPFDVQDMTNPYRYGRHIDLMAALTGNGRLGWSASLKVASEALGLDTSVLYGEGSAVPGWVAEGKWGEVSAHLRGDLLLTAQLARRLRSVGWV